MSSTCNLSISCAIACSRFFRALDRASTVLAQRREGGARVSLHKCRLGVGAHTLHSAVCPDLPPPGHVTWPEDKARAIGTASLPLMPQRCHPTRHIFCRTRCANPVCPLLAPFTQSDSLCPLPAKPCDAAPTVQHCERLSHGDVGFQPHRVPEFAQRVRSTTVRTLPVRDGATPRALPKGTRVVEPHCRGPLGRSPGPGTRALGST